MPSRARSRRIRGTSSSHKDECTSSRLSRLHTPSRSRLASISRSAMARSAPASTNMTAPPSAWAIVRTPCRAASAASERVLSPLPRRITSGIRPGWLTSARAEDCPGTRTSWIMAGSSPAEPRAGAMTSSASAMAERMAAEPVRSTPALRDLTNWEEMSTTTLGRASKLAPITPTGLRRSSSRRPPGSSETVRRDGSAGIAASSRSWPAMASSRFWSRRSRSSSAPVMPSARAAAMSASLAASTWLARRPSASAIARSASSRRSSGTLARSAAGPRAARAAVSTALSASASAVTCVSTFAAVPAVISYPLRW